MSLARISWRISDSGLLGITRNVDDKRCSFGARKSRFNFPAARVADGAALAYGLRTSHAIVCSFANGAGVRPINPWNPFVDDDSRSHGNENHPLKVLPEEMCEQKYQSQQWNGEFRLVEGGYRERKGECAH